MTTKRIFQLLVLFLLSIPTGFLTIITEEPHTSSSEYLLLVFIGTFAWIVVGGGISLLVYAIFRKRGEGVKRALQVYAFFTVLLIVEGLFYLPGALRERDRHVFLGSLMERLPRVIDQQIASGHLPAVSAANHRLICACIHMTLDEDSALLDALMAEDASVTKSNTPHSAILRRMSATCLKEYLQDDD